MDSVKITSLLYYLMIIRLFHWHLFIFVFEINSCPFLKSSKTFWNKMHNFFFFEPRLRDVTGKNYILLITDTKFETKYQTSHWLLLCHLLSNVMFKVPLDKHCISALSSALGVNAKIELLEYFSWCYALEASLSWDHCPITLI